MPDNRQSTPRRTFSKRTIGLMAGLLATAILTAAALLAGSYEIMSANPATHETSQRG
jgi:hypothetical protein